MRHPWNRRLGFWWIAEDHPDQPAVVASPSGPTPTYGELAGRAHQVVHALRSRGVVNIYPAEVEGLLTEHPAVRDVAVIGIPDAEWGESVKAVVEVADGCTETGKLYKRWLRDEYRSGT